MSSGVTAKDVDAHQLIAAYAAHLKRSGKLPVPKWVDVVKTAKYKELAPLDQDWWYMRAASIARHIYLRRSVGVGALQKKFGGKQRRGNRPNHRCEGSSSIARKALQALEAIKIVEKDEKGGRKITQDGQRDLDRIAAQVKEQ